MNLFARLVCYAFMAYVVLPESYVSTYLLVELESSDYVPEPPKPEPEPPKPEPTKPEPPPYLSQPQRETLPPVPDEPYLSQPEPETLPPVPDETMTDEIPLEELEPVALGRSMKGGRSKRPGKKRNVKKVPVPTKPADCSERVGCVGGKEGEQKSGAAGRYWGMCLVNGLNPIYPVCVTWHGYLYVTVPCYYHFYYLGVPYYFCYHLSVIYG